MGLINLGYNITTDPNYLIERNHITPELSSKLDGFYHLALDGKKSTIQKILDAIEQYPNNPQLKNYLSVLYGKLNETQKVYEVNKWIIAEHPNYLFGKLNLANEYYLKQEYDKIPVVLGQEMEIKALYPDRQTFHLDEVISFLYCTVLYFTAIDNLEQAEVRYDLMQQLAPNTNDTEMAFQKIFAARMKAGQKRYEEEQRNKISVTTKNQQNTTTSKAPNFNHQEINWLYCNGLYIEKEKLNTILSLPKITLVQDLELVLQDSINRYDYFKKSIKENGWDEEKMNFVIHSICLLGELKASESINTIFNIFSQSEAYLEQYLGDSITAILWEPLFKIASNNLEECKQFMFRSAIDTFARTTFLEMAEQIALHHPERRQEVVNWFDDIIEFFLSSSIEDNVIDSDLIGLLICNVIHIKGIELLPQIEKLFEREIVSKDICGDWKEVSAAFKRPDKYDNKKEILSIVERYKEITSTWAGYNEEDNIKFDYNDYSLSSEQHLRSEPKIGRNEPCPCGSGKKYKKCCLNR